MIPKKYLKFKPEYFDKGKRGIIYTFKNKKTYSLKVKRQDSNADQRLKNESKYLKILNKYNLGPKLVDKGKDYIVYEFVEGKLLKDIKLNKIQIKEILRQCFILDTLKINKMEMHHPLKHILFYKTKVTMIDFERCYNTNKPKNVTQFCQYLIYSKAAQIPLSLIKEYKKDQSKNNFKAIIDCIKDQASRGI